MAAPPLEMPVATIEEECALLREWLSMAGVPKAEIRELAAKYFTENVHSHFDSQKLNALEDIPLWLDAMCGDPRWRTLLYDLYAANSDCLLLNTAVRMLASGEHATEVSAHAELCALIGTSSSLQTFASSLSSQLSARLKGRPGAQEALDGVACAGEVQLFSSQLLLRSKALTALGRPQLVEEIAAQMAEAAAAVHGQPGRRLQLLAMGLPRQSALMSCLLSILSAGSISPADAQTLHDQSADDVVAARTLSEPAILELLLQALFDPSRPPKPATRTQLLRCLTCASIAAADRCAKPGRSGSGQTIGESTGGGKGAGEAFESTLRLLEEAQQICERNEVSEIRASVVALQRCTVERVAACGVLIWTSVNLTNPRYSGARFNISYLPEVLCLISAIAAQHPALRGAVCTLLHRCLVHEPPTDSEHNALNTVSLRRSLLDALLLQLAHGCIVPVLTILSAWVGAADLSLIRHAIHRLLSLVSPPYSPTFVKLVLSILRQPSALEAHRAPEARQPLLRFTREARLVAGVEGLAADVEAMLTTAQ